MNIYKEMTAALTDHDLRVWQASLRLGACHHNSAVLRDRGSCGSAYSGSIATPVNVSWMEATRACVAHCLACAHCNYVSLSAERGYCAWYTECRLTNLWRHGQHDAFTGLVPKQHRWLASSPRTKQSDSEAPAARLQELLDRELRRRPLRAALPTAAGLHRSESCLREGRWLLAVGTSVTRILFMRLVEEHIGLDDAVRSPCAPGWRFQHHGFCDSLKRGAPCVVDIRSNSSGDGGGNSGGEARFTFVWAYGWAQHAEVPVGVLATATSLKATAESNALRSEAFGAQRLVGRFAVQTAEALRQLLREAPRAPDVLLSGPGAWNLRDPPGVRLATVGAFLDFVLGCLASAGMRRGATTAVWLGAQQTDARWRQHGAWRQSAAELAADEARLQRVAASRGFATVDASLLPPCETATAAADAAARKRAAECELRPRPMPHPAAANIAARAAAAAAAAAGAAAERKPARCVRRGERRTTLCSEEDCTDRARDHLPRCAAYGARACDFTGGCAGPHVFGAALSHVAHALLRGVCAAMGRVTHGRGRDTHRPVQPPPPDAPSLADGAFEARWRRAMQRQQRNVSFDARAPPRSAARGGGGGAGAGARAARRRPLALVCALRGPLRPVRGQAEAEAADVAGAQPPPPPPPPPRRRAAKQHQMRRSRHGRRASGVEVWEGRRPQHPTSTFGSRLPAGEFTDDGDS